MPRHSSPCARSDVWSFHIAATEFGKERDDLPLWAVRGSSSPADAFPFIRESADAQEVTRQEVRGVSGGLQVLNLLSSDECAGFVQMLEDLGFHTDAAVSLPYSFRHMSNCNMVVPEEIDAILFQRCKHLLPDLNGHPPLGINAKFR